MLSYEQLKNIGFIYVRDMLSCNSPYGEERVRSMRFFAPGEELMLQTELDNISLAIAAYSEMKDEFSDLEHALMLLKDVRRSVDALGHEALTEIEYFELKRFLMQSGTIAVLYDKISRRFPLADIEILPMAPALDILNPDKTDTAAFHISSAYSEKLGSIRALKRELELKLRESCSEEETAELKSARQNAVAQEEEETLRIRHELSKRLSTYKAEMLKNTDMMGKLDFLLAKAKLAVKLGAVKPEVKENMQITLEGMVNPEVDDMLRKSGGAFTPVSITLSRGATVITGANMGGKSVALKTAALNVILFHAGMFVFAEKASIPLLDHITLISEELEDKSRGLSSFGGEIQRLKDEIKYSKGRSLMLFDEFARGTNPEEGALIVRALVRHLAGENAVSVLTTHYDGVAKYAMAHYRVIGLRDFSADDAINRGETGVSAIARHMNYGLYRADDESACPHDALSICRLLLHGEEFLEELLREYETE